MRKQGFLIALDGRPDRWEPTLVGAQHYASTAVLNQTAETATISTADQIVGTYTLQDGLPVYRQGG